MKGTRDPLPFSWDDARIASGRQQHLPKTLNLSKQAVYVGLLAGNIMAFAGCDSEDVATGESLWHLAVKTVTPTKLITAGEIDRLCLSYWQ